MNGTIYKITNEVTGEAYIGQTVRDVNQRFHEHTSGAYKREGGEVSVLQRAIREYGSWSFKYEVLETNISCQSELTAKETYYIVKHGTRLEYNGNYGGGPKSKRRKSIEVLSKAEDDLVIYDNSFNNQVIKGITVSEQNLLLGLLLKLRNKGTYEISIPISEVEDMTGLKDPMPSQANRVANSLRVKLLETDYSSCSNVDTSEVLLFDRFESFEGENGLEWRVRINEDLSHLVNDLNGGGVTEIPYIDFKGISNKYGKRLCRLLSQHKADGEWTVSSEDFRLLMDFPEDYLAKKITSRIINPSIESCKEVFESLRVEKIRKGRRITGYKFKFDR